MSVVRKYQSGGGLPNKNEYSDFQNFLAQEINKEANKGAFTSKGEKALRDQASMWVEGAKKGLFDKDEQGNHKYYSTDNLHNTYSINPKDNAELSALDLEGHNEQIKANLFGQLNLDKKKANTWIANARLRYEAQKGSQSTPTNTTMNQEVDFGPLENYMRDVKYHKNDNWGNAWQDLNTGLDEKGIQKRIGENYKEYLDWHIGKMNTPEQGVHYNSIDNQQELYNVSSKIASGDFTPEEYTKFKDLGSRYGTDFSSFYTPKTAEQITTEAEAQKVLASQNYVKELTTQGIAPEVAQGIASKNYKVGKLADNLPEHVKKYVTDKQGIVLDMPNGKQIIIDQQGQPLQSYDFNDPDNNPGTYFTNDAQGFNYFAPGTKGYSGSRFADPVGSGLDLRPIIGSFPGHEGYKIYGVPKPLSNGTRDYIKHLHLRDPNSDKSFDLFKKGDVPGVYQDQHGTEFTGDLTEWGAYVPDEDGIQFSLEPQLEFTKAYDKIPAVKKDNIDLDIDSTLYIGRGNVEELRSTLSGLKYIMEHEEEYPDLNTQNKAHHKYSEILRILESKSEHTAIKDQIINPEQKEGVTSGISWLTSKFIKNGGILKYQQGSAARQLTREEYNAIYNPKQATTTVTNDPTKRGIRSSVGTLRDMNWLDGVSLAGSAASIIPGVGVFGGAATTIADAINDYSDGDFSGKDWGNLGMNLAFTGLSAVGFGTLGAAAKAAKIADTAIDAAKVAKIGLTGVEDIAKLSKPLQEGLELMAGGAKTFKEAKLTATELKELKALKDANGVLLHPELSTVKSIVNKIPDTFKSKVSKIAEEVVEEAPKVLPKDPNWAQREFSGIIGAGKYLGGLTTLPKAAKVTGKVLGGLGAINAGVSAASVAGNVFSGNGKDTQVQDLKNTMYLASGLRGLAKTRPMANLAKQINTAEGEAKQLFTIGKSTYAVDPKANQNIVKESLEKLQGFKKLKEKTRLRGTNADNIKANEETAKKYKDHLSKILGKELDDDVIKSLMGEKVGNITKTNRTAADLGVSQREYDRAKAFGEGKINYWHGKNYWKKKQGGVLKASGGATLGYNKEISKTYQYDKGYIDYVMGLDQNWFNTNKTALQKAVGNYPVENLQQLQFLGTDNKYGPVHKFLDFNYQNSDAGNGITAKSGDCKPGDPCSQQPVQVNSKTTVTPSAEISQTPTNVPPQYERERRFQLGNAFKNIDKNDIYNLAGFLGANSATNRAIGLQKKAAYAGLYSLPFMQRQYFRSTSPYSMFADKQAAQTQGIAGRMASSTSDFDKGANVMFTGADKGVGLKERGFLADLDAKQKTTMQQMESDQKVDQYNTQVYGKNKGMAAETAGKMFTLDAAGAIAKNQNFQNYLQQLNRSDQIKQQEAKYKNYYNLATDPNTMGVYDEMNNLNEEHQKAMEAWNKAQENTPLARRVSWDTTPMFKKFNDDMKTLNLKNRGAQQQLYNASLALQMPGNVQLNKRGGSLGLEDKKELLRYQHELKRSDNELEIFYKVILKNNELMYKSLSRIFK